MPDLFGTSSNDCTIAFDLADRQIIFVSPNAQNVLGFPASDFYNDPGLLFEMIGGDHGENIKNKVNLISPGEQLENCYQINTATGKKIWVNDRKSIVDGAKPGQKILLSQFSNYNPETPEQNGDARLGEQFLNSLIDSQTNFLIRFDTNGCFTFANRQFLKKFGYKRNELTGKNFSIVTIPEELELCEKTFVNCLKHPGKVIPLAHKKRDKAGNVFDTEWEFISVAGEDGAVIAVQGIGRDITAEKKTQEEMAWTKNNLEALINNTEDQIWSVDRETRYVYMNNAYRRQILQLTGSEPKPGDYSYLHPGYADEMITAWIAYYARALSGERYTIISESIDPLTNNLLSFEISFNPIYKVKGDITGVGCFARNITKWLETEKAIIDQNERLMHIASLTSHELRRPVASMLGLINIMDRRNFFNPDNKEVIEHLLTVGNEIDDVIRLIIDKTFVRDDAHGKDQLP